MLPKTAAEKSTYASLPFDHAGPTLRVSGGFKRRNELRLFSSVLVMSNRKVNTGSHQRHLVSPKEQHGLQVTDTVCRIRPPKSLGM